MKRDKEWLKGKLNTEKYYRETSELKAKTTYGELYDRGVRDGINAALELVEQLDEPEVLSQDWIDEHTWNNHCIGKPFVWVDDLQNLLLLKQDKLEVELEENFYTFDNAKKWLKDNGFVVFEKDKLDEEVQRMADETCKEMNEKPVIPKFVADYIEKMKYKGLTMYEWFSFGNNDVDDDVNKWLYNNLNVENRRREDLLFNAIRHGYEVEKEKLYRIKFSDNQYASRFSNEKISSTLTDEELAAQYTESEIKAIDKRFWSFSEEVKE